MIDFTSKKLFKLKGEPVDNGLKAVGELLIDGEEVINSYVSIRDRVVFTDKRIISCNVQGVTGMKIDYTSIPYSKIQAYSVETNFIYRTYNKDKKPETRKKIYKHMRSPLFIFYLVSLYYNNNPLKSKA